MPEIVLIANIIIMVGLAYLVSREKCRVEAVNKDIEKMHKQVEESKEKVERALKEFEMDSNQLRLDVDSIKATQNVRNRGLNGKTKGY